jgi:dethiobiotin synthetase
MKIIFVAGTDTGAGKTVVTGLLAGYLSDRGYKVATQKWVQTGLSGSAKSDIAGHIELMGKTRSRDIAENGLTMPFSYKFPSSPHLAARLEGKMPDPKKIAASLRALSKDFDVALVEGTGGLMVPFNNDLLFVDLVKKLNIPVILAAGNKLGAINHTLLSLEAINSRKIKLLGVVFTDIAKDKELILEDNAKTVDRLSKGKVLGRLSYAKDIRRLRKYFEPIGAKISNVIARSEATKQSIN